MKYSGIKYRIKNWLEKLTSAFRGVVLRTEGPRWGPLLTLLPLNPPITIESVVIFEGFQRGGGRPPLGPMMPREGSLSDAVRLIVAVFLILNFLWRLSTNEKNSELVRSRFADYMKRCANFKKDDSFSENLNFMIKNK